MSKLANLLKRSLKQISNFTSNITKITLRLFGIKQIDKNAYDSSQFMSAMWILVIGLFLGLFIAGIDFPILIWATTIFGMLAIVNLDEALLLTALYAEQKGKNII